MSSILHHLLPSLHPYPLLGTLPLNTMTSSHAMNLFPKLLPIRNICFRLHFPFYSILKKSSVTYEVLKTTAGKQKVYISLTSNIQPHPYHSWDIAGQSKATLHMHLLQSHFFPSSFPTSLPLIYLHPLYLAVNALRTPSRPHHPERTHTHTPEPSPALITTLSAHSPPTPPSACCTILRYVIHPTLTHDSARGR